MPSKSSRTLACTALIALCQSAQATLPDLPPAPVARAVQDLLILDAQRALAAERAAGPTSGEHPMLAPPLDAHAPVPASAYTPGDTPGPVLAALYGVGHRLRAHVLIDGHEAVFASGRTEPLNGASTPWRLKRIVPPCIDLESDQSGVMRLCNPSLAVHP